MDRISMALGGDHAIDFFQKNYFTFLSSEDWKMRHTGIIMVSQLGEALKKLVCKFNKYHRAAFGRRC